MTGCVLAHCFSSAFIIATIALRGVISTTTIIRGDESPAIHNALDVVEIVPIVLSLITNVLSTVIVGLYVWYVENFVSSFRMGFQYSRYSWAGNIGDFFGRTCRGTGLQESNVS